MPSTSENQRKLMCIALSIKRGETDPSYSAEAAKMANEMDEKTLADYCGAKVQGSQPPAAAASPGQPLR